MPSKVTTLPDDKHVQHTRVVVTKLIHSHQLT